ncbi:MAG TPA: DJ-1/PfpI family protein [Opitutaceae bacterium]|nr:DJ-1/PfpI family protein [Opitutaceae bacterium]
MKKNVAILIFDDVEVLDFTGPFEVFALTDELRNHEPFHTFTVATDPGSVRARNGLKVVPDFTLENCPPPHVLVVPGGSGTRALLKKPALLEWLRQKTRNAELVMSVCTGALVLAKAGLLDGLRVTTHHLSLDLLRELAPAAIVDPSQRFHDNGKIITAAGISAGLDSSLHVVARLLDPAAAEATARQMEYGAPSAK